MKIDMVVEDVYLTVEYIVDEDMHGNKWPVVECVFVEGVDIFNLMDERILEKIEERIPNEIAEQKWSHDEDNRD